MKTQQSTQAEPHEPRKGQGIEVPQPFVPTPERLSQYLEVNVKEVMSQMESVEGRQKLYEDLLRHEQDLRTLDPEFHPEQLKKQLDLVADTLTQKKRYLEDVRSPEKKGMFRKAWDSVKGFAKKHPVVTTVLVLAAVAASVAGAAYMVGGLEALMAKVGMSHLYGAEGAGEAADALGKIIDGAKELPNYYEGPTGPTKL